MIYLDNRQNKINVDEKLNNLLEEAIRLALKEEDVKDECEISVIFVDNDEIKNLNKEFRNIDKETDVLSFPMLDYPDNKVFKEVYSDYVFDESYLDEGRLVLGDIAISLEKAKEQSIEYRHSFEREVVYLIVHSVLHLLGYDHMNDKDKMLMRSREEYMMNKLNIKRE